MSNPRVEHIRARYIRTRQRIKRHGWYLRAQVVRGRLHEQHLVTDERVNGEVTLPAPRVGVSIVGPPPPSIAVHECAFTSGNRHTGFRERPPTSIASPLLAVTLAVNRFGPQWPASSAPRARPRCGALIGRGNSGAVSSAARSPRGRFAGAGRRRRASRGGGSGGATRGARRVRTSAGQRDSAATRAGRARRGAARGPVAADHRGVFVAPSRRARRPESATDRIRAGRRDRRWNPRIGIWDSGRRLAWVEARPSPARGSARGRGSRRGTEPRRGRRFERQVPASVLADHARSALLSHSTEGAENRSGCRRSGSGPSAADGHRPRARRLRPGQPPLVRVGPARLVGRGLGREARKPAPRSASISAIPPRAHDGGARSRPLTPPATYGSIVPTI